MSLWSMATTAALSPGQVKTAVEVASQEKPTVSSQSFLMR